MFYQSIFLHARCCAAYIPVQTPHVLTAVLLPRTTADADAGGRAAAAVEVGVSAAGCGGT